MPIANKEIMKEAIPILKAVSEYRKRKKAKENIDQNFNTYRETFIKYSSSGMIDSNNPNYLRMRIVIGSHILEKGLSHSNFRPGFGKQSIIDLQSYIVEYIKHKEYDVFAVENAVSLLKEYHEANVRNNYDDSDYVSLNNFEGIAVRPIFPYNLDVTQHPDTESYRVLATNRHSVRMYEEDGLPLDADLLNKVISLANTAPSACNRQATHVFAITNREMIKKVETIHGGCKDFGRHASAFLLITSDLSLYSSNEVKLPIYDAGIYTMNLLYSLQTHGLYSCALNGSFPGDATRMIHELTSIPERFDINGLIAVYNLPQNANVLIAVSPRRNVGDVLTIIE